MTKKEWENCNTCWTCKHRKILAGRIHCGHTIHDGTYKVLWNVDIINSPYCPHREKEDWRDEEVQIIDLASGDCDGELDD